MRTIITFPLQNPHYILESVDSNDNKNDNPLHSATDINTDDMGLENATKDSPEDKNAELGQFFLLSHEKLLNFSRTSLPGVELTNLCLLLTNPID